MVPSVQAAAVLCAGSLEEGDSRRITSGGCSFVLGQGFDEELRVAGGSDLHLVGELLGPGSPVRLVATLDGRLQHVGIVLLPSGPTHPFIGKSGSEYGYFGSTLTPRNWSAVTAAAMLVKTKVFDDVGGFDAAFARDFNDVDFCLRVQRTDVRVAWTPYAKFDHHEGASIIRRKASEEEAQLFAKRWGAAIAADPCYSLALNQQLDRIYEAR